MVFKFSNCIACYIVYHQVFSVAPGKRAHRVQAPFTDGHSLYHIHMHIWCLFVQLTSLTDRLLLSHLYLTQYTSQSVLLTCITFWYDLLHLIMSLLHFLLPLHSSLLRSSSFIW